MADNSKIEWTDATWNPVTGCSVVSPGCTNCYAMKLAGGRMRHHPSRANLTKPSKAGPVWNGVVKFNGEWLDQPLRWKRPRTIFVVAHGDLFHENVPDEWIDRVFAVMALASRHRFQVLTKRAGRMHDYLAQVSAERDMNRWAVAACRAMPRIDNGWVDETLEATDWPLPNVWLGVSAEDQERADERITLLLDVPAAVRFVSAEPLLGPIDLTRLEVVRDIEGGQRGFRAGIRVDALRNKHVESGVKRGDGPISWVIVGGESGPGARPMHPHWARSLRDQCDQALVPFHFKQHGAWFPMTFEQWSLGPMNGTGTVLGLDGTRYADAECFGDYIDARKIPGSQEMWRIGKKNAGRMLDGRTWDGMPA